MSLDFLHGIVVPVTPQAEANNGIPILIPEHRRLLFIRSRRFQGISRFIPHSPHLLVAMIRARKKFDGTLAVIALLHGNAMVQAHADGCLKREKARGHPHAIPIVVSKFTKMTMCHNLDSISSLPLVVPSRLV
jgi:hypothetical protein